MSAPNLIDIARRAGVGKSTAARALSGTGAVSESTRAKVLRAAEACKYRANTAARTLRRGHSRLLGVAMSDSTSRGFLSFAVTAQKLEGIAHGAKWLGYDLQLFIEDLEDVEALRRLTIEKDVRGFFFNGHVQPAVLDLLKRYRIPWIGLNWRHADRPADPHCWTDFAHAGRTLSGHLAAIGCRRVLSNDWLSAAYGPYADGLRAGWQAAGRAASDLVILSGYDLRSGARFSAEIERALDGANPPDGILSSFDGGVKDIYRALRERGLRPGADIAVATFDDLEVAANLEIPCTAYLQPTFEMGETAVREMDRLLTQAQRGDVARDIPGTLNVRESTRLFQARNRAETH
ncbi:MAG: LacI family DNA-binding transcriptional regulator [Planctomycetes bacterium]|nr:LacI family DNA-binding transcriptional regulator [Planctomycetota bacterium]